MVTLPISTVPIANVSVFDAPIAAVMVNTAPVAVVAVSQLPIAHLVLPLFPNTDDPLALQDSLGEFLLGADGDVLWGASA